MFFDELSVRRPDHDLDVGSGPHGERIGRMTAGVGGCVREEEPDVVLVYGDTNSRWRAPLRPPSESPLHLRPDAGDPA